MQPVSLRQRSPEKRAASPCCAHDIWSDHGIFHTLRDFIAHRREGIGNDMLLRKC